MPDDLRVSFDVDGLEETKQKMEQVARDLHGRPMVDGMQKAVLLVVRGAKKNAPVDTGRLRSSITGEVAPTGIYGRGLGVQGIVGTNVSYALVQEERVHYLQRAFDDQKDAIVDIVGEVVGRIVRK